MNSCNRIFLIGPMGAGKTSVGQELAKLLGCQFYDADAYLEQIHGVSVANIFQLHGEQYFRNLETNLLENMHFTDNIVFATGGGCILHPQNRKKLRKLGCVVHLKVSITEQCRRLAAIPHRPPLPEPQELWPEYLTNVMRVRSTLYEETADVSIPTDHQQVLDVVNLIVQKLGIAK